MFQTRDITLVQQLTELHAVESLVLRVLELGSGVAADGAAAEVYAAHARQTRGHLRLIRERLAAHDAPVPGPEGDGIRGGVLRFELDDMEVTSPEGVAVAAYTLENLEIGLYHVLSGLARQSHDHQTEIMAHQILEQEENAAELIASRLEHVSVPGCPDR